MAEFKPKGLGGVGTALQASTPAIPKVELPVVGDTMKVAITKWGGTFIVMNGSNIEDGTNILEVEVKAIKKARTIFE